MVVDKDTSITCEAADTFTPSLLLLGKAVSLLHSRTRVVATRYNDRNQASTDESNQDEIVEPDTNLEGFDSVRIHSLLEECIVTESNQSRLV